MLESKLFSGLPEAEIRRLVAAARRRTFARHEVVFHRDDPGDTLHLVSKGRFAVRMTTPVGDTVTLAVLGSGEGFGALALVEEGAPRSATVAALEPGETYSIRREDFERLRSEHPALNDVLVRLLAAQLRRVSERLVEALFVPAEARVLRRLLELSGRYPGGRTIPLTQEEIAGLAGTSRATVNRVLRAEATRGTLEVRRGRTVLLDPGALARRAGV